MQWSGASQNLSTACPVKYVYVLGCKGLNTPRDSLPSDTQSVTNCFVFTGGGVLSKSLSMKQQFVMAKSCKIFKHIREYLHDTGATFAPERVHSGSLS